MTALPLVAALVWTAALLVDSAPFESSAALLVGIGLLAPATVAVVGMTLTGARWAHRLGVASAASGLVLAVARPIDALWITGLVASVAAGAALFLPRVTLRMRKLPAATGPPQTAVFLSLVLLGEPFVLGLLAGDSVDWAILVVGLSAPVSSFAFSRVLPGGLVGVRLLWPLLAIALSPLLSLPAAIVAATTGIVIAALAWRPEVKTAFHPPREVGSTYPIPPELAPEDILDAANIDDKGQPRK